MVEGLNSSSTGSGDGQSKSEAPREVGSGCKRRFQVVGEKPAQHGMRWHGMACEREEMGE